MNISRCYIDDLGRYCKSWTGDSRLFQRLGLIATGIVVIEAMDVRKKINNRLMVSPTML